MRGDELAKGWLLALVEDAPLESAAAIMAGDVARDGPRICGAVVRAIYDEADLRRIEAGGVLEPLVSRAGELAGVRTRRGRRPRGRGASDGDLERVAGRA